MTLPLPLPVDAGPVACPRCGAMLDGPWVTFCHVGGHYVEEQPRAEVTARKLGTTLPPREEEDIRLGIVGVLQLQGFAVWNLSQPRATKQTPGLADLYVCGYGVTAWIEVKRPGGEQSADQRIFEGHVIGNGGRYMVWRDESEALEWCRMVRGEKNNA